MPRPQESCLHEMFERQVEKIPDAVAVVFRGEALSYAELNRRANLVAHHLRKLGVGPESLVGILMERSIGMAVGLMGILKAGGAYLPLDPSYPAERLSFMLTEADAALLLTEQRRLSRLPTLQMRAVCIDRISGEEDENLHVNVFPNHPAYIIYTSGSTGRPKGVVVSHSSLVGHCASVAEHYRLGQGDRVLQFASPGFDVAAEELFPTWISGAVIALFPDSAQASLAEFTKFLSDEELTVVNLPVTFWHRWIVEHVRLNAELPSALRLVIVGSEKVLVEQLSLWQSAAAGECVDWLNAYGLTETTITSCIYEPSGPSPKGYTTSVPVGRPIGGAQVYILDQSLQPTPVGVHGELCIGGSGPARCYHNQATLTACKFIPDPFGRDAGARLFRTGDYGRFLSNFSIDRIHKSRCGGFGSSLAR
jgi:amino acid adenylation domain-containing protein